MEFALTPTPEQFNSMRAWFWKTFILLESRLKDRKTGEGKEDQEELESGQWLFLEQGPGGAPGRMGWVQNEEKFLFESFLGEI